MNLDQFFTKRDLAAQCWRSLLPIVRRLTGKRTGELLFVEPSAGDGSFYDLLPAGRIGLDIEPRRDSIMGADFLAWDCPLFRPRQHVVVVGNPPFGKRGALAVRFFCKAAEMADVIAFILPVIFRKHFIHKQLPAGWQLAYQRDLPRDAFYTDAASSYEVNTEFQVWTRLAGNHRDRRLTAPPPRRHQDFLMWQYNNTRQALKMFDNPFDFAIPCQGWQDYTRRETDAKNCEKHKQWLLFKPADKIVHKRLYQGIDYAALALRNTTSTPGFRKGDVVQEYIACYG